MIFNQTHHGCIAAWKLQCKTLNPWGELQNCFKVTSVKKCCHVINLEVFQNSQCKIVSK